MGVNCRSLFIGVYFFIFLLSSAGFAQSRLDEISRFLDRIESSSVTDLDAESGKVFLYPFWKGTHYDPFKDVTGGPDLGFNFSCEVGYARLEGDTTYHITAYEGTQSELEFPLDCDLFGGRLDVAYNEPSFSYYSPKFLWSLELYGDFDNSGVLKDSDWIEGDGQPGLDVYSESPVNMDAKIIDTSFVWNAWVNEGSAFGLVLGYRYHKFEYTAYDTDQVGYGIYSGSTAYYSGDTLTYDIKYKMPYIGFSWNTRMGERLSLDGRLLYSPWVDADDVDDHLLRYKRSTTNADGDAFLMSLHSRYSLTSGWFDGWFLDMGMEYGSIDADGVQHQEFYAGTYAGTTYNVHNDISSEYGMAMVSLGKEF